MDAPFRALRLPGAPDADGWVREELEYVSSPRRPSKFKTILDADRLFAGGGRTRVVTRSRQAPLGEPCLELDVRHQLGGVSLQESMRCVAAEGGRLRSDRLVREVPEVRHEEVRFGRPPFEFPSATYPEVLLPFLMRGEPRDGARRALYAWTADRFCARVYYEVRGRVTRTVPAGRFDTVEVWMYPDLNDWIALGSVITKLAKPLLPRYELWFEASSPWRTVRFEGPFGPPGAPEVVLELAG